MNEDSENEREKRLQLIGQKAQDPVHFLEVNKAKGKTCAECITFLRDLRQEIGREVINNPSYSVGVPNGLFLQFYKSSNGSTEHFVALFTLLKEAGFNRVDVESALMDDLPIRESDHGEEAAPRSDVVKKYLDLTQEALASVYREKS